MTSQMAKSLVSLYLAPFLSLPGYPCDYVPSTQAPQSSCVASAVASGPSTSCSLVKGSLG